MVLRLSIYEVEKREPAGVHFAAMHRRLHPRGGYAAHQYNQCVNMKDEQGCERCRLYCRYFLNPYDPILFNTPVICTLNPKDGSADRRSTQLEVVRAIWSEVT